MSWKPNTSYWSHYADSEEEYREHLISQHEQYVRNLWIGWSIAGAVILAISLFIVMNMGTWIHNSNVTDACHQATQHRYLLAHFELAEAHNLALIECGG